MALNLSDLTSPSTSDDVLSDIYTTADQGDGIALMDDLSPNDIDATQTTANHQPIAYDADNGGPFARFDGSDDRMSFTLASPITNGTVFFATKKGSYAANIDLAAGTHDFSGNKIANNYNFANDLVALLLFDFALSQSQIDQLTSYFVTKGAVEDYGAITTFTNAFRGNNYTTFPSINTSSGTNFPAAWMFSYRLVSFPLIVVTAGSAFSYTWFNCPLLAHFPANFFDNWNPSVISSGVFDGTWGNCSLTSQSVENILTSIDTSGRWATTNGASGGTPLGDPVIDIDYNVSTGSLTAATLTAIEALNGRGWSVNINNEIIVPNILQLQPAAAYSLRSFDAAADPNVVNVRRSSDGATSDFTASEVSDGTLEAWVNTEYSVYTSDFSSGVDGWSPIGAVASNPSDPVNPANNVLQLTVTASGSVRAAQSSLLTIGQSYDISAEVYIPSSNTEVTGVLFLDGFNVDGIFIDGEALPTDQWVTITGSGVSEGTSELRIQLDNNDNDLHGTLTNNAVGDTVYIKNVQVAQTTADGHVTTWYDQGGTNHATQSTASDQPLIVENGVLVTEGGEAALSFDGAGDDISLNHSDLYGQATLDSYYVTSTNDSTYLYPALITNPNSYGWVAEQGSNSSGNGANYGSGVLYANGTLVTPSTRNDVYNALVGRNLAVHQSASTNNPNWTTGNMVFGDYQNGSLYSYAGKLQEMIFFNTDQSANRAAIEKNINDHFNIY